MTNDPTQPVIYLKISGEVKQKTVQQNNTDLKNPESPVKINHK